MSNGVRVKPPRPKYMPYTALGIIFGQDDMIIFEGTLSLKEIAKMKSLKLNGNLTFKISKISRMIDTEKMWISEEKV